MKPSTRLRGSFAVLALAVAVLVGTTVWAIVRIEQQNREVWSKAQDRLTFASTQAERELLRLINSIHRFRADAEAATARDVQLRFDIFWSRLDTLSEGQLGRRYHALPGASQTLERARHTLEGIEADIASIGTDEAPDYGAMVASLTALRDPLHKVTLEALDRTSRELGARRDQFYQLYGTVLAGFGGALLASALLIGLIINNQRWLRRSIAELGDARATLERQNQELAQARDAAEAASRAKSGFVANVSHELRTPLNSIKGYTDLLIEEAEDEGAHDRVADLTRVRSSANYLHRLVTDVLDLARIESGRMAVRPSAVDLGELTSELRDVVFHAMQANDNRFEIQLPASATPFVTDEGKLRQILVNLVGNAGKFTQAGTVRLSVDIAASEGSQWLHCEVQDDGPGMSEEDVERVFGAFVQGREGERVQGAGTGLGLSIVEHLCQLLGGTIRVATALGEGTRFSLALPQLEERDSATDD